MCALEWAAALARPRAVVAATLRWVNLVCEDLASVRFSNINRFVVSFEKLDFGTCSTERRRSSSKGAAIMSRVWLTTLKRSASRPKITPRSDGSPRSLPMWSPKQRQMIDVYVSLVQRCYREHLARQAASQARLLRVDPKLLLRLHAVWLRRETKAARLMQQHWRASVVKVLPWQ